MRFPTFPTLLLAAGVVTGPLSAGQEIGRARNGVDRVGQTESVPARSTAAMGTQPNILILLADDLGVDNIGVYAEGGDLPATPNIDSLAAGGLLFRHAYSHPVCSPTRAGIMTGRYGFRHGVGFVTSPNGFTMDPSEFTLPEMLDQGTTNTYTHAAFGKWHLSNDLTGGLNGPAVAGFSHFSGTESSLFFPETYFNWTHVVNGTPTPSTDYEPEIITDETIAWMNAQTDPFLCYLAFNLPHDPFHRPPDHLHNTDFTGVDPDPEVEPRPYYKAMVEAMDTLIGDILTQLDPAILANTIIVFSGDNGTPAPVTAAPFIPTHAKTTTFEGGVNVPFIVSGPPIMMPGTESDALIHTLDIFGLVAEAAGVDYQALAPSTSFDCVSLYPYFADSTTPSTRTTLYSEIFYPNGEPPSDPLDFKCAGPIPSPRGSNIFLPLDEVDPVLCQENLGYGGPGNIRLRICGPELRFFSSSRMTIDNGPPNTFGFLFEGEGFEPLPFGTGTVVPTGPFMNTYMVLLDSNGSYTQEVPHIRGLEYVYYQSAFQTMPAFFEISNAVKSRMVHHGAVIRNAQYKLMIDSYNCTEAFFDLVADPFESTDLLMGTLTATEQTNYDTLRAELGLLVGS